MSKPFTWSYTRLTKFETCASQYYHLDVAKDVPQTTSEHLEWGSLVHEAAARYLSKGIEMPPGMPRLQAWCERVKTTQKTLNGKLFVEQKLAITEDLKPCAYFDSDVWYRAVIDVLVVAAPVALLVDWKTGKRKEDSVQLALSAAVIFAHYPHVQKVRTDFIWLKEGDDNKSTENFARADMHKLWHRLHPRLFALKSAHRDDEFPPTHNKLCLHWCPVTQCKYHGVPFR